MKKASFEFVFDSEKEAEIVLESLNPEVKNKIPKTNVKISIFQKKLFLEIESNDISSLRAACNSYLRWINTALAVKKTV
ncbi:MAG: KEOPS complex subunit Pcc1 [Candidatus Thermoplasmatota archaeon]|jgi:tRNA threonylcarbamoyladenosine modification (KEOPS) complex  Pcc1 subunit|nr:KEOPS complex subunit Pcc1 [Candidatus Thermoplasmatota archaeon]